MSNDETVLTTQEELDELEASAECEELDERGSQALGRGGARLEERGSEDSSVSLSAPRLSLVPKPSSVPNIAGGGNALLDALHAEEQKQRKNAWVLTFRGHAVKPLEMRESDIDLYDIAHSLSMQCRWNGHTRSFYSVAQHCILVSKLADARDALWGLLHDAAEAYLHDMASPIKRILPAYVEAEGRCQEAILRKFRLPPNMPRSVHRADMIARVTEARDLMPRMPGATPSMPDGVKPLVATLEAGLRPAAAERAFLTRYREILVEGRYAKYGWYKETVSRVAVPTVAADVALLADDNGTDDEQTDPGVTVAPTECEELDND